MENLTTTERLEIGEDSMTSDVTRHTATRTAGGWAVSWLPGGLLDRDAAITAMMLVNLIATTENRMSDNTGFWALANDYAAELGLSGPDAVVRASFAPEDAEPAPAVLASCPSWCHDQHDVDDDTHYGPALDVPGKTTTEGYPYMLAVQCEPGDETEIVLMTTESRRMNEPRDRVFTVDQARHLYAALGELLAVVDPEPLGDSVDDCAERALRVLAEYRATGRATCWGDRPLGRLERCLARDLRMLALTTENLVELVEIAEGEQS